MLQLIDLLAPLLFLRATCDARPSATYSFASSGDTSFRIWSASGRIAGKGMILRNPYPVNVFQQFPKTVGS